VDIIIPTYGRAGSQSTLKQLNGAGIVPTLVVQERERHLYKMYEPAAKIYVLPDKIRTIAPTRQHILEFVGSDDRMVMMDDDLVFFKRRDDDRTKLRDIDPAELAHMLEVMDTALSTWPHVGIAAREGANRVTESHVENTRIMRVLGYNRKVLRKECITFGRIEVMEDFDVALRLLRMGHPNLVLNEYAHNQAGSGAAGGCSHFRTKELHAICAHRLAEMHPGFVKVVQKETKGAWGGGTRTDVNIYWKKAFAAGEALRGFNAI